MEFSEVQISEAEPAIWKQIARDAAGQNWLLRQSLQEWSGDAESDKLEHFSASRIFYNSDASFPERTVSLKHLVGIHCKSFQENEIF